MNKKTSQSYGFSSSHVWLWELDHKESGDGRTDAFELWCWRRLLRVRWTARKSSQSIVKEINPEYSLEGLMLKLKLHYFGHLMWRADSLEKTLMLGKIAGRRRRGWQRMRWLSSTTDSMNMSLSKLQEIVKDSDAWRATIHGIAKCRTWKSNWTTTVVGVARENLNSKGSRSWTHPSIINRLKIFIESPFGARNCCRH